MKTDILSRLAACLTAVGVLAGCIHETFPMGSTQREDQVMMSDLAIEGLVNGIPSSMMKYNTAVQNLTICQYSMTKKPAAKRMCSSSTKI